MATPTPENPAGSDFHVSSVFGAINRRPLVSVELLGTKIMVTPKKAKEMALMLLEAAEASRSDGLIFQFFDKLNIPDGALIALRDFRIMREEQALKDDNTERSN